MSATPLLRRFADVLAEHFGKLAVIWIACFLRCLFAGGTSAHQSHRLVETKVEQIVCEAFAHFSLEACSEVRGGYMGGECDVAKLYLFHIMLVDVAPYGVDEAHFAACPVKDATDGIFLIACSLVFERLNRREDLFLHGDAIESRAFPSPSKSPRSLYDGLDTCHFRWHTLRFYGQVTAGEKIPLCPERFVWECSEVGGVECVSAAEDER